MHIPTIGALAALTAYAAAAPTVYPFSDGYPNPSPEQLKLISAAAGGSLPNGPLPTKLTPAAAAGLQLIELNEAFEVAYFTSLLKNITDNVPGYELKGLNRTSIIDALSAVEKQEEIHAFGANGILKSAGETQVAPCQYNFPVTDFSSAITLANTFTDVVIGVLPMALTLFASDGGAEIPLVNILGSILSQESEQNGYYRSLQQKRPSAAPLLTTEAPQFAFTFLQNVIAPGCAGVDLVKKSIPTFGPLTVVSKPQAKNQTVTYSVPGTVSASDNSIVYLSGQNLPLTVPITNVACADGANTFDASLPFDVGFAKGLTIATLVKGTGRQFANSSELATATLFGPGIIEIE